MERQKWLKENQKKEINFRKNLDKKSSKLKKQVSTKMQD